MNEGPFDISLGANTYRNFIYYCCSSVSIDEVNWNDIVVFPNPTDGAVHVEFTKFTEQIDITAFDPSGREIYNQSFYNASEIEFNLPEQSGMYFIYIKVNKEQNAIIKKVIKQ
jgi:hypothetical protein